MSRNIAIFLAGRISTKINDSVNMFNQLKHKYPDDKFFIFISINELVSDDKFNKDFCDKLDIPEECIQVVPTVESEDIINYKHKRNNNLYSMFYHNSECMKLIQNYKNKYNIHFDVIIKYRADLTCNKPLNIIYDLEDNTLYIPCGADWGGLNDQVAYGNENTMKIYCDCVSSIISLCKNGVKYHPETLLKRYIEKSSIKVERFKFEYRLNK